MKTILTATDEEISDKVMAKVDNTKTINELI